MKDKAPYEREKYSEDDGFKIVLNNEWRTIYKKGREIVALSKLSDSVYSGEIFSRIREPTDLRRDDHFHAAIAIHVVIGRGYIPDRWVDFSRSVCEDGSFFCNQLIEQGESIEDYLLGPLLGHSADGSMLLDEWYVLADDVVLVGEKLCSLSLGRENCVMCSSKNGSVSILVEAGQIVEVGQPLCKIT